MSDPTPINTLAPCEPWGTVEDDLCCPVPEGQEDHASVCLAAATEILYALAGRRYGVCSVVETLNPTEVCGPPVHPSLAPTGGLVLTLATTPVQTVTSVTEDGTELVQGTDYRVDDWRLLVRIGQAWSGEVVATYTGGPAVPDSGRMAVGELACELMKACQQDKTCRLSSRVQDVARQGITVRFIDPMDFLDKGRTGLVLCDLFLSAVNPHGLTSRSTIVNPDDFTGTSGGRYRNTSTSA